MQIALIVFIFIYVHTVGCVKMHEVFRSWLPSYFLKDLYVKWSQFDFQTIFSKIHYSPLRLKFYLMSNSFIDFLSNFDRLFSSLNKSLNKTSTSKGNSEFLKKWSEIQIVIISHINLSKNNWGAKIWRPHAFWHTLAYCVHCIKTLYYYFFSNQNLSPVSWVLICV